MSDTDMKALREQYEAFVTKQFEGQMVVDGGDMQEAAWEFIEAQFQIAVPLSIYEEASTNVARLQAKVKALPSREELRSLLETMLWDRGRDVRLWPEDEAEAYREFRHQEGDEAARRVMFDKVARAIGTRIDVSL